MVEFLGPRMGGGFRTDAVTVQKTAGHLRINLVRNEIGLFLGINIEKEVCEFVKHPCRY